MRINQLIDDRDCSTSPINKNFLHSPLAVTQTPAEIVVGSLWGISCSLASVSFMHGGGALGHLSPPVHAGVCHLFLTRVEILFL